MNKYHVYDIKWDTDGAKVKLPTSLVVKSETRLDEERLSDFLTETYGYCHNGFSWETTTPPRKPTSTATVKIPKKTLDQYERWLKNGGVDYGKEKIAECATTETWTARFRDGFAADIKVNALERESGDFFAEAVLYDSKGHEVDFSDCEYSLRGKWRLSSRKRNYIVKVVEC